LFGRGISNAFDAVLAALSALQHLTRLQLPFVRREQLQHLQLPKLQQLYFESSKVADQPLQQFQLAQLTSMALLLWLE
jgi:hypothetical protein